jgi:hypothetical protein
MAEEKKCKVDGSIKDIILWSIEELEDNVSPSLDSIEAFIKRLQEKVAFEKKLRATLAKPIP